MSKPIEPANPKRGGRASSADKEQPTCDLCWVYWQHLQETVLDNFPSLKLHFETATKRRDSRSGSTNTQKHLCKNHLPHPLPMPRQ